MSVSFATKHEHLVRYGGDVNKRELRARNTQYLAQKNVSVVLLPTMRRRRTLHHLSHMELDTARKMYSPVRFPVVTRPPVA